MKRCSDACLDCQTTVHTKRYDGIVGRFLSSNPPPSRTPAAGAHRQPLVAPRTNGILPNRFAPAVAVAPPAKTMGSGSVVEDYVEPAARMAFLASVAMVIFRMAVMPELLAFVGAPLPLLYLLAPLAVIGLIASGGFARVYRATAVWCWTGLVILMMASTPFSSWIGGSAQHVISYVRVDFICLFALAGSITVWSQVRSTYKYMAIAGFMVIAVAKVAAKPGGDGRLALDLGFDGTISNPNDLAAHIVLMTPFLLYVIAKSGTSNLIRAVLVGTLGVGLWIVLGTASRGAMISMGVMSLYFFIRMRGSQRIFIGLALPVAAVVLFMFLPQSTTTRLMSLFVTAEISAGQELGEAEESFQSRSYLVKKSIEYTLANPVFGVGMDQFANYEGMAQRALGQRGNWHQSHNSYTQVSSELGIPALVCFLGALISTLRLVNTLYRRARREGHEEMEQMSSCFLASMIAYMTCITFLSCAYRFTLPAMISLGVAMYFSGMRELDQKKALAGR